MSIGFMARKEVSGNPATELFIGDKMKTKVELIREVKFLTKMLSKIAMRPRHTIEQRLAASALSFWGELQNEKKINQPNTRGDSLPPRKENDA